MKCKIKKQILVRAPYTISSESVVCESYVADKNSPFGIVKELDPKITSNSWRIAHIPSEVRIPYRFKTKSDAESFLDLIYEKIGSSPIVYNPDYFEVAEEIDIPSAVTKFLQRKTFCTAWKTT